MLLFCNSDASFEYHEIKISGRFSEIWKISFKSYHWEGTLVQIWRWFLMFVGKGIFFISEIGSNGDLKLEKHNFKYNFLNILDFWVNLVSFGRSEIDSDRWKLIDTSPKLSRKPLKCYCNSIWTEYRGIKISDRFSEIAKFGFKSFY